MNSKIWEITKNDDGNFIWSKKDYKTEDDKKIILTPQNLRNFEERQYYCDDDGIAEYGECRTYSSGYISISIDNDFDFSLFDLEVNHIFSAYDKITYKGIGLLKVTEHKECNDENFDMDAFATAAWVNGEYAGECHDIILKGPIDIESVKPK